MIYCLKTRKKHLEKVVLATLRSELKETNFGYSLRKWTDRDKFWVLPMEVHQHLGDTKVKEKANYCFSRHFFSNGGGSPTLLQVLIFTDKNKYFHQLLCGLCTPKVGWNTQHPFPLLKWIKWKFRERKIGGARKEKPFLHWQKRKFSSPRK